MYSPNILICTITVPQVNLKRNLRVVDDPFCSFVMKGKTFKSVLNSQDPSDPSDDFIASALLRDQFRKIDPMLVVSNIQAKTKKFSLQVELTCYSQH